MTERLPRLTPSELDNDQRAVFDGIAGGDRSAGAQHFPLTAPDGSLNGPFGIMLHAPSVGDSLQRLGAAIRYGTSLSARVREIAILMVAQAVDSPFEWWAHERVGRAAGLTNAELGALQEGRFISTDTAEQATVELCNALLGRRDLDDAAYGDLEWRLGATAMIEVTVLVGYYRTLADLMVVFGADVPED